MHKALRSKDDVERLYVSQKEEWTWGNIIEDLDYVVIETKRSIT